MGKDQQKSNDKKQRPEHLSTTIGDLLRVQGNDILKTEKKSYKKNNKNYKKKPYIKKEKKTPTEVPVEKSKEPKVNESLKKAIDEAVEKGILRADDAVKFDMRTPEEIEQDKYKDGVVVTDGSMEEFAAAFLSTPEPEGPKMTENQDCHNKFVINSEYITKAGTDTRIRTDEFIKK